MEINRISNRHETNQIFTKLKYISLSCFEVQQWFQLVDGK